jgi:hypothetical protein
MEQVCRLHAAQILAEASQFANIHPTLSEFKKRSAVKSKKLGSSGNGAIEG